MPIETLPDDVFLAIFDFYVRPVQVFPEDKKEEIETWQTPVHVCRRWRNVVFGSPLRLNLRLCCTPKTPVRRMLDVWPRSSPANHCEIEIHRATLHDNRDPPLALLINHLRVVNLVVNKIGQVKWRQRPFSISISPTQNF